MEITSPRGRSDCCTRRKIHPRTGHAFSCPPTIRLPFSFSFSLSLFLSRLASSRHDRATRLALCNHRWFSSRDVREREREKVTVEKFADSLGEARVSRRGETEIKSKRKRREREREREGFVAGIYFSSSISQAGYRVRDGYLYVCKVIAPGWRTSASATCRVHLIAKVLLVTLLPPLPIPLSRRLWR